MLTRDTFYPLCLFLSALIILNLSQRVLAFSNCEKAKAEEATDFLYQAYDLENQGRDFERKKRLLERALQLCPNLPEAYNTLGSLYEDADDYSQAIIHYKKALKLQSHFSEAWYGLGETYYNQGSFPLSLEAHLHTCRTDEDSKRRVQELLQGTRYAVIEQGGLINKESLLVLYDAERRETVNQMLYRCGLRAWIQNVPIFYNFQFYPGKATLKPGSESQLDEIAAALRQFYNRIIKIHVYLDSQSFAHLEPLAKEEFSLKLSKERAETIAKALTERAISSKRIETYGHGYRNPLIFFADSPTAMAKNRRIEIEIGGLENANSLFWE